MKIGRIVFGERAPQGPTPAEQIRAILDSDREKAIRWEEQCRRLVGERRIAVDALIAINAYDGDNQVVLEKIASDALHALGIGR